MTEKDQQQEARYRRSVHVAWRRIGSETVVLDLKGKRAFGLNEPGGALWRALAEIPDGASAGLASCAADARAFVAELQALGLVEATAEDGAQPAVALPAGLPGTPRVVWSDEVRSFGAGTCAHLPGQGTGCTGHPAQ